jgi:Zn-finger nucleic acid-binding protein
MIVLELAEVEVDYCTNCGGIWLDAGELELLLGNSQQTKQLLDSFKIDSSCTEKRRKCPICLKKMQKIVVGPSTPPVVPALSTVEGSRAEPSLLIDKCARGDGLWFDHGELQDVLDRAKLDKNNKIQKLLADIFPG